MSFFFFGVKGDSQEVKAVEASNDNVVVGIPVDDIKSVGNSNGISVTGRIVREAMTEVRIPV
jgi:hypothetical protein